MSIQTIQLTSPAQEPTGLSLDILKKHVRAESFTDDDDYLTALGIKARRYGETITGTSWVTQQWVMYADSIYELVEAKDPLFLGSFYPAIFYGQIPLYKGPVQSVQSFQYSVAAGNQYTTWDPSLYIVATDRPGYISPVFGQPFPILSIYEKRCVKITYTAGFDDTGANVPAEWIHAALMHVGIMYERREGFSSEWGMEVPMGIKALYASSGGESGIFH